MHPHRIALDPSWEHVANPPERVEAARPRQHPPESLAAAWDATDARVVRKGVAPLGPAFLLGGGLS